MRPGTDMEVMQLEGNAAYSQKVYLEAQYHRRIKNIVDGLLRSAVKVMDLHHEPLFVCFPMPEHVGSGSSEASVWYEGAPVELFFKMDGLYPFTDPRSRCFCPKDSQAPDGVDNSIPELEPLAYALAVIEDITEGYTVAIPGDVEINY